MINLTEVELIEPELENQHQKGFRKIFSFHSRRNLGLDKTELCLDSANKLSVSYLQPFLAGESPQYICYTIPALKA